eukprot:166049-Pleurochrysis_carterae.AAC.1
MLVDELSRGSGECARIAIAFSRAALLVAPTTYYDVCTLVLQYGIPASRFLTKFCGTESAVLFAVVHIAIIMPKET